MAPAPTSIDTLDSLIMILAWVRWGGALSAPLGLQQKLSSDLRLEEARAGQRR
jgi:hypothetical protein